MVEEPSLHACSLLRHREELFGEQYVYLAVGTDNTDVLCKQKVYGGDNILIRLGKCQVAAEKEQNVGHSLVFVM